MVKEILVTLDGSKLAETILPYVTTIAKGMESRVTLLSAVDFSKLRIYMQDEYAMSPVPLERLERSIDGETELYLTARAKRL